MSVSRPPFFRFIRWPLIAIAVFLLLALLAWAAVPMLVPGIARTQIEKQLGRKATLGDVRFNPFTLTLSANNFVLYEADGATPALTLQGLLADVQLSSLFHLAPVVREVRLEKPSVHLVRLSKDGAGRYNFSDILERLAARPKSTGPAARFSVANIQLAQGSLRFDDKVTGKQVSIAALDAGVPFVSNFDSAIETFIEPRLSATINGTRFALKGRSKPFSGSRETTLALDLEKLDLARLAGFSPTPLPLTINSAFLSTTLDLNFMVKAGVPEVTLSGQVDLADLALSDRHDRPLLKTRAISTRIGTLNLLSGDTVLNSVTIQAPQIWAALDENGTLNWAALNANPQARAGQPATRAAPPAAALKTAVVAPGPLNPARETGPGAVPSSRSQGAVTLNPAASASATPKPGPIAPTTTTAVAASTATAAGQASAGNRPAAAASATAIRFTLEQFRLQDGVLNWRDAANASPAQVSRFDDIAIEAGHLSLAAGAAPAYLRLRAGTAGRQKISFAGQVDAPARRLAGRVQVEDLALANYQSYLNRSLAAALSGRLSLSTLVVFDNSRLRLRRLGLVVDDFRLAAGNKAEGAVSAKKIILSDASLDTGSRRFNAAGLTLAGLAGDISRHQDGQLNLLRFVTQAAARPGPALATAPAAVPASLAATPSTTTGTTTATMSETTKAATPSATSAKTAGGAKKSPAPPPAWLATLQHLEISNASLALSDESLQPPVRLKVAGLALKADNLSSALDLPVRLVLSGAVEGGTLAVDGSIAAQMKSAQFDIDARNLPFTMLQPYYGQKLNIDFAGGTASTKGKLTLVLPDKDTRFAMKYSGAAKIADFRSLNKTTNGDFLKWKTLDLAGIEADIGKGRPMIALDTVTLSDFYMRAILSAEGKLNLREIVVSEAPASGPAAATATGKGNNTSVASVAAPAQDDGQAAIVRVGKIDLRAGNINFTDNFVKPNYTVNMTGMNGSIGTIASNQAQPASIELAGKIDNAAPVSISGSLNPLFKPMFLDIKASANGIELPRLTPYATKYAGYPIEKGKLSMDVTYRIDQQKLTAQNSVRIDQLTFGERVDSPTATNLPVLLAVKLLKDRNGQIEINLPVSGSLDDPQFSIGGLIGRVLLNLLTRAITSPFALISSAFGGGHGDDLGYAEFEPGTSTLTPAVQAKLDTLARAMADRPALRLDITGRADRATDTEGARLQQLNRSMRMMKLKDSLDRGQNTQPEDVVLSEPERVAYLEKVYKAAKFEKPRNALGLNKSLAPAEMQALILGNTEVSDDNLRALASRRATVVRRYLESSGKIDLERMFLIAPKLGSAGGKDKAPPNRVEFTLN